MDLTKWKDVDAVFVPDLEVSGQLKRFKLGEVEDCVGGGFGWTAGPQGVNSVLLGVYAGANLVAMMVPPDREFDPAKHDWYTATLGGLHGRLLVGDAAINWKQSDLS